MIKSIYEQIKAADQEERKTKIMCCMFVSEQII